MSEMNSIGDMLSNLTPKRRNELKRQLIEKNSKIVEDAEHYLEMIKSPGWGLFYEAMRIRIQDSIDGLMAGSPMSEETEEKRRARNDYRLGYIAALQSIMKLPKFVIAQADEFRPRYNQEVRNDSTVAEDA